MVTSSLKFELDNSFNKNRSRNISISRDDVEGYFCVIVSETNKDSIMIHLSADDINNMIVSLKAMLKLKIQD